MASEYPFHLVAVWDQLGGAVRVARKARVQVLDPSTGLPAPGLTQNGQPVSVVTTDANGAAEITATIGTVRLVLPGGLSQDIVSPVKLTEAAAGGGGGGAISYDTDGVPYIV